MSKVCELTGKRPVVGHKISHSNVKSKRRFEPNLIRKKFYIPELDKTVTLKVSTKAMKTIDKLGLYAYLKKLKKKGRDIPVKL